MNKFDINSCVITHHNFTYQQTKTLLGIRIFLLCHKCDVDFIKGQSLNKQRLSFFNKVYELF